MSDAAQTMLSAALALSSRDRLSLAQALLDSLPAAPNTLREGSPEAEAELARRIAEYRAGHAGLVDGPNFFEQLREKSA